LSLLPGEKVLRKVIITSAITGAAATPTMSEYLPLTPKQIADDAVKSCEAGAAIVHIHARKPENGEPTADLKIFRQILEDIKKRCDAIVCITTGGAGSPKERIAVVPEFKPELATLNLGSLSVASNFALYERIKKKGIKYEWEEKRLSGGEDAIWENTYKMMREYAATDKANNTKPELEVWDTGQLGSIKWLLENKLIDRPVHVQFVMGSLTGMSASPSTLIYLLQKAREDLDEFTWSVATAGKDQLAIAAVALALGGNVRVGLEDNLYCGYGLLAKGSYEQVERATAMARLLSIEPATPAEARQMLGLKGNDKVNF
jgi:uncharacterized protein (DUF849 family)